MDVAREAADFVLLEGDPDFIRRCIKEGRRTFASTLKYILTTTSANLGNMISMAVVSLLPPFLPLLAGQMRLNNFLSDVPAVGLAGDSVDRELVERPRRWNMRLLGRFMIEFGLMSSVFDFLTFGLLLWSSVTVVDLTFAIPYLPGASVLGFTPLPATAMLSLAAVVTLYVASTEVLKANFYRRHAA